MNLTDVEEGTKFGKRFVTVLVGKKVSSTVGDEEVGSSVVWVPDGIFVGLVVGLFEEESDSVVVVGLLVVPVVGSPTPPTSSITFDGDWVRVATSTGLAVGFGLLTFGGLVIEVSGEAVGLGVTAPTGLFVG